MKKTYITFSCATVFALVAAAPLAVGAEGSNTVQSTPTKSETSNSARGATVNTETDQSRAATLEKAREEAKAHLEEAKKEVKQKFEAKRLSVCNERTDRINTLLKNNSSRAQTTLKKFEAIVVKVEAFKTSHNLSVADYDALVADVTAKEQAAITSTGTVSGTTFNCDNQDAANVVGTFHTGVIKSELNALKEYRTAIKKLISAVKQAAELNTKTPTTTGGN